MGFQISRRINAASSAVILVVFVFLWAATSVQNVAAVRVLKHSDIDRLVQEKLPKGPVPSHGSPCTNIPGQGSGHCALINGINVGGRVIRGLPTLQPPAGGTVSSVAAGSASAAAAVAEEQ